LSEDKKDEVVSEALKAEEKITSNWYILDLEGNLLPLDEFNFKGYRNLRKFSGYEVDKDRTVNQEPPHVTLMKSLELVDYEPASDPGNMRYYPKGRMIKALLEDYVTSKILDYGGMEVETPIMYDMNHPTLAKYLHRFPARQYIIESDDDKYFLRFAACFGQFLMAHDATISYRDLPLRLYELTKYSFRREQRGELVGLRRLRSFTMPDVHAMCATIDSAKEEMLRRYQLVQETLTGIGFDLDDFELGIRLTEDFYNENKDIVNELVKRHGKPALVEMWSERFFYFVLKYELNFIDALGKASALATDQIDVENGERYDIKYMDKDGTEKHPYILHCSPSGAIERDIYGLLEKAHMGMKKGIKASLPLWLAPTQVRLIPVTEDHIEMANEYADELNKYCIRTDVDDRAESVQKKIREAEKQWTPYMIVLGDKEGRTQKGNIRQSRIQTIPPSTNASKHPEKTQIRGLIPFL